MNKLRRNPPKTLQRLLEKTVDPKVRYDALGDYNEQFGNLLSEEGFFIAMYWYSSQIAAALPRFLTQSFYRNITMFKNYLKIALRNLSKHKTYSMINISGLAVGIASCILILLFVQNELSYDRFHKNADNIYRLVSESKNAGVLNRFTNTSFPTAPYLKQDFPEIKTAVRITKKWRRIISYDDRKFYEEHFSFADPDIFDVFTFPFIEGDPNTALSEPFSVVVTERMAKKYFGNENPIGKVLGWDNGKADFTVTGIVKNVPENSHFTFDFLASHASLNKFSRMNIFFQFSDNYTYILVPDNFNRSNFEAKLPAFVRRYGGEYMDQAGYEYKYILQPLKSVHLGSRSFQGGSSGGSMTQIYIVSVVAFLIIVIASINFMNLSTARSSTRAKEVGMRKITGAYRTQLIKQFIGESVLLSFIGLTIGLTIVVLVLHEYNQFLNKNIELGFSDNMIFLSGLFALTIFIGVLSGIYPALFLSSFSPVEILRGKAGGPSRGVSLRKLLVLAQFSISALLIIATWVVSEQMDFIRNKDLGFNKEQVMVVKIDTKLAPDGDRIREELMQDPNILNVALTSRVPSNSSDSWVGIPEGTTDNYSLQTYHVDYDYLTTMQFELAAGRNFSREMVSDGNEAFIINEETVRLFGWNSPEEALGKGINWGTDIIRGKVIGVIKDFNDRSFREKVKPLIMMLSTGDAVPSWLKYSYNHAAIRLRADTIAETIESISDKWETIAPHLPLDYFFLDDNFARLHEADRRLGQVFGLFSSIAIFIACLGLFGLASFTAQAKTKEIGIRKVLGSSVTNITFMLSKDFVRWVVAGNVLAWPIAYFAMNKWLNGFYYKTGLGLSVFLFSLALALLIAIVTVSFQSIKAAVSNPVKSLRCE